MKSHSSKNNGDNGERCKTADDTANNNPDVDLSVWRHHLTKDGINLLTQLREMHWENETVQNRRVSVLEKNSLFD